MPSEREGPARLLGTPTAMLVVVASMIGTGVFTTTGFLVRDIGSLPAVLAAWAIGGVIALFGALSYAELVAALPHNGGEYQLLSRIFHPSVGFVAGWTSFVVGFSAPLAASAIAFGKYAGALVPGVPPLASAIVLIVLTSALHAVRVKVGGDVQNFFTAAKVLLIAAFVIGGLAAGTMGHLAAPPRREFAEALMSPQLAVGLVYVSFAYSGWNAATYIAGEVKNPAKSLPLALLIGTLLVTALYLGLNLVFLTAAPAGELSGVVEIGHVAAAHLFGEGAGQVLTAIIAIGLVSTVSAIVMTGARVSEAMGQDHRLLRGLVRRHANEGPIVAIALQAALAIAMVLTASFDALLTYIGFTLALFSALTVAGVFVLRVREPALERPYRTWGYPVSPIAFIALMIWMIVHTIRERPAVTWIGFATLAAGGVLYAIVTITERARR